MNLSDAAEFSARDSRHRLLLFYKAEVVTHTTCDERANQATNGLAS